MAGKHTRLRMIDEFTCSGAKCPASCCSFGWSIDIDTETYSKWQQADKNNHELGLLDSITTKYGENTKYLKHVNNRCMHLSGQGLCTIQVKLGHDFIPKTCQEYPRISWASGKYGTESLSLSCPEVLNLLVNESNEHLFKIDKKARIKGLQSVVPSIPHEMASLLEDYVSQVMRNNKYPVNILLLTIAKKLVDIVLLSQQGLLGVSELQKEVKGVSQQLKATQNEVKNDQLPGTPDNNAQFWRLIYELFKAGKMLPAELEENRDVMIEKIECPANSSRNFDDIYDDIRTYRRNFYNNIPEYYRDLMCRYLRVKFLNNSFPQNPFDGNLVAGFLYCILPYTLIQLTVWIAAENKKDLAESDIIEIIYKVEREFDHTVQIYKYLTEHPRLLRIDNYYSSLADV